MAPSTASLPLAQDLVGAVAGARIIQLGQVLDRNPTRGAGQPDFEQSLYETHQPGHAAIPGQLAGVTGASDRFSMAVHSGTHMDSLGHIGYQGALFDGTRIDAPGVQDEVRGVRLATRENFSPIVSRGVLLDFARMLGVERVPQDYVVRLGEFEKCCAAQGVRPERGDTVLFRTGWDTLAGDREAYIAMPVPGPELDVARHLSQIGVVSTGSDTMPYEAAPGDVPLAVHVELIPKSGIHIYEMMDLRELAETGVHEFLFIAAPLRILGITGSPVNPLAVIFGGAS